jgi:hypothetical protein
LQITICFKLVSCLDHEDGSGMFFRTVSWISTNYMALCIFEMRFDQISRDVSYCIFLFTEMYENEHVMHYCPFKKLHGLSPRANYTDRATAACQRSDCQLLRIEGATWSAWQIPTAVFWIF